MSVTTPLAWTGRRMGFFAVPVALALSSPTVHAKPQINAKLSLTGLYYVEQEQNAVVVPVGQALSISAPLNQVALAAPLQLGFGDVRATLSALSLAKDRIDLRFDMRVRGAQAIDFERKFNPAYQPTPTNTVVSRGYLGGAEFDLREALVALHITERVTALLGRMYIAEADAWKVDAARLKWAIGVERHWEASLFFGGSPNPYSRSLLTDYEPPCGAGVASGNVNLALSNPVPNTAKEVPVAPERCQTPGAQLALTGGLTGRYTYPKIWGSVGLVGSFFGGVGDGGPVVADGAIVDRIGNVRDAQPQTDSPRIFLSWNNQLHPVDWFDAYSDVVIDFASSHGVQLTRGLFSASLRLRSEDRLNLRSSYAYLSPLAIDMFLSRLLYNRFPNGTTLGNLGVVENNLAVVRTGRHEGRLSLDGLLAAKLRFALEGRLRPRTLLDAERNQAVYGNSAYVANQRPLAGDAMVGLRDGGSIAAIRSSVSYMFLEDFRATSHLLRGAVGRDFADDRLHIDIEYAVLIIRDHGQDESGCADNLFPAQGAAVAQLKAPANVFLSDCFGRRSGITHEVGITMTTNPWRRLFFLADYRFAAMLTDPQSGTTIPPVLSHALLGRAEIAY